MSDKDVNQDKLDNRDKNNKEEEIDETNLNNPGSDFGPLKESMDSNQSQPLDNTPAGKAMGFDDGREMTDEK